MTIHQSQQAAEAAPVEGKRLYRLFSKEDTSLETWTWASSPTEALAIEARALGLDAELADGGRRKVGLRTKLKELLERSVRSKEGTAIQEELREMLAHEEALEHKRAESRKLATAAPPAPLTIAPAGEPVMIKGGFDDGVPDGLAPEDDGDPDFDGNSPDSDVEEDDSETDASGEGEREPPGGAFDEDDVDDFSDWDNK